MTIRLEYLADHPDLVPVLAGWHYQEWRELIPEWSLAEAERELGEHRGHAAIPTTVVAFGEEGPIGSASLLIEDLPQWRHLTPWVASVYVVPAWRGRGIGTRLVRHLVAVAGQLGAGTAYLLTEGQAEFYRKIGWEVLEVSHARGRPITIMQTATGR